jgi:hypothetical protein
VDRVWVVYVPLKEDSVSILGDRKIPGPREKPIQTQFINDLAEEAV